MATARSEYVITIDWDDALELVALNLTITDAAGKPSGTVAALSPDQLTDADLCATTKTPDVVAALTADRNLVYVAACGGRQAAFQWTAPNPAVAPGSGAPDAIFRGSLLASNADNAVTGDAVTDISRVIGAKSAAPPAPTNVGRSAPFSTAVPAPVRDPARVGQHRSAARASAFATSQACRVLRRELATPLSRSDARLPRR